MMGAKMKEIIRLREEISYLKDFDTSIYEVFEEKLTKKMTDHINNYTERRLVQMKKQLISVKKQKINITRTKAIFRKKNGVL